MNTTALVICSLCAVAAVGLGAACTTNVYTGPGFDTGTGAAGGGGEGGASQNGTGSVNSSSSTGGDDGMCGGFEDTMTGSVVTLTVVNGTDASVFITAEPCDFAPFPRVFDESMNEIRYKSTIDGCGFTCAMLQESMSVCTGEACAEPPIVEIMANGSYTLGAWGGTMLDTTDMPLACYFDPASSSPQCDRRLEAPAGTYQIGLTVYDTMDCGGTVCEPCGNVDELFCEYTDPSYTLVGSGRAVFTTLDHPNEGLVTLTLQNATN